MPRDKDKNNGRPRRPSGAPSRGKAGPRGGKGGGKGGPGGSFRSPRDGRREAEAGSEWKPRGARAGGKPFGAKGAGLGPRSSEGKRPYAPKPYGAKSYGAKPYGAKPFGARADATRANGERSRGGRFERNEDGPRRPREMRERNDSPRFDRGPRKPYQSRDDRSGEQRPRFKAREDRPDRAWEDRPPRRDADRRFSRDDARGETRQRFDRGFERGSDRPWQKRSPGRPHEHEGQERPRFSRPREDRPGRDEPRRFDRGNDKPWQKRAPERSGERGNFDRPRFARPNAEGRDRDRDDRGARRFDRPREDRAPRPPRPPRDGWHEHPRSDSRSRDERPRRDNEDDSRIFPKRPAFGGRGAYRKPERERDAVRQPPPRRENKTGERIAKVVARAGMASRREAEDWITQGRVAVNGRVINSPALDVTVRDKITIDGAPLPERERTRLFLYHKPRGLMTTHADPEGRPTVFDNLPEGLPRLISVGRLDFNTEGLLLLTNDGGLARALELPQTGWLRRYRVRAHGEVTQAQLDMLRNGVEVDGVKYGSIEATLEREQGANVWLVFAIREGKNREVRNVLSHLGLEVNRLIRVSYGPFQLGEIAEGLAEEVKPRVLGEQIGEKLLQLSGAYLPSFAGPASTDAKTAGKPRAKRAVVADRKGRKVVVERSGGDDDNASPAGSAPYRRPQRRYHGKRDLTPRES